MFVPFIPARLKSASRPDQTIVMRENDDGAMRPLKLALTGTENRIAWAEQIRANMDAEFDRIAGVLESVARRQTEPNQSQTRMAIAILEEQRGDVMARNEAAHFIRQWQESRDEVRLLITHDLRHKAAKRNMVTPTESTDH